MDFKGNIHNKGNEQDRIILNEDGDYLYPYSKAIYDILEFGSVHIPKNSNHKQVYAVYVYVRNL